jgi:hypothetical protein
MQISDGWVEVFTLTAVGHTLYFDTERERENAIDDLDDEGMGVSFKRGRIAMRKVEYEEIPEFQGY